MVGTDPEGSAGTADPEQVTAIYTGAALRMVQKYAGDRARIRLFPVRCRSRCQAVSE